LVPEQSIRTANSGRSPSPFILLPLGEGNE
jgi:hypothetical protein